LATKGVIDSTNRYQIQSSFGRWRYRAFRKL